jgi:hypothetical protein
MVFFWIFTVLVYTIIGIIIQQWFNITVEESGREPFNKWWSFFIIFGWPIVMYAITLVTIIHGCWLFCKHAWKKIKSWFKKDKNVDVLDDNVNDTELNTDININTTTKEPIIDSSVIDSSVIDSSVKTNIVDVSI